MSLPHLVVLHNVPGGTLMSDTAKNALRQDLKDFLDNPRTFMTSNIVLPPSNPKTKDYKTGGIKNKRSGIFQFSFAKSTTATANRPLFRIEIPEPSNQDLPRFMAYYCHYDSDNMFSLMLDDEMNLMLTPTMNGCSFGVGSETSTGARLVAHANASRTSSDDEGKKQQGVTQAKKIGELITSPTIIGPSDYAQPDVYGTTVGVRKKGHWSFFMQTWFRTTATGYILKAIIDIA